MFGRRVDDHVFVGSHVVVPILAFADVGGRKLPVLFWFLQPLEETELLFLPGEIEEEFANYDSIARQITFESADVLEALLPDVLGEQRRRKFLVLQDVGMHSDDQHLFIVGAIEDTDSSPFGQIPRSTPEIVMI